MEKTESRHINISKCVFSNDIFVKKDCGNPDDGDYHDVVIIDNNDETYTIIGGIELVYITYIDKDRRWESEAIKIAKEIISSTGGIAWNDNGKISLVVPVDYAVEVDKWMRKTRDLYINTPFSLFEEDYNNAIKMVVQGAAIFNSAKIFEFNNWEDDFVVKSFNRRLNKVKVEKCDQTNSEIVYSVSIEKSDTIVKFVSVALTNSN